MTEREIDQLKQFETDDGSIHPLRLERYTDWEDASNVRIFQPPQCSRCLNLTDPLLWKCRAFPDGIPGDILGGDFDHTKPYPGDSGIRFDRDPSKS
jgi:hypothetical protein